MRAEGPAKGPEKRIRVSGRDLSVDLAADADGTEGDDEEGLSAFDPCNALMLFLDEFGVGLVRRRA